MNREDTISVLMAVNASGFKLPEELSEPYPPLIPYGPEHLFIRSPLDALGDAISMAFLRGRYAVRTPTFHKARAKHLFHVLNLARTLSEALDAPHSEQVVFYPELPADFFDFKMPDPGDPLRSPQDLDAKGWHEFDPEQLRKGLNDLIKKAEHYHDMASDRASRPGSSSPSKATEVILGELSSTFRIHLARSPNWVPELSSGKTTGADPFTEFAVAAFRLNGKPLQPASLQRMIRRAGLARNVSADTL